MFGTANFRIIKNPFYRTIGNEHKRKLIPRVHLKSFLSQIVPRIKTSFPKSALKFSTFNGVSYGEIAQFRIT